MSVTLIYHNPRCSKSRAALAILREQGIQPQVIEYLKTPPDAGTLRRLLTQLRMRPRALLREGEAEYAQLGLDDPHKSDAELIAALVAHPVLLQRPIVVHGGRAVLARPPEKVRELF